LMNSSDNKYKLMLTTSFQVFIQHQTELSVTIILSRVGLPDLPVNKAERAHQVSTRLQLDVLVILSTDLTQLERRTHLTVQFILLLRHSDVVLGDVRDECRQVRVGVLSVRIQVATSTDTRSGQ